MAYEGYSLPEYLAEVRAILDERYAQRGTYEPWESLRIDARRHYDSGTSPTRAAQSIAWAYRMRKKPLYRLGGGPQIESGYAEVNRVGSRREWETRVVDARLNDRARFLGFRNIDGNPMAVWRVGKRLVAQTAVGPRHPSRFARSRDRQRRR